MTSTPPGRIATYRGAVAANIRAELAARSVTITELARRVGRPNNWTSSRVNATGPIDVEDVFQIAAALGCALDDLTTPKRMQS